MSHKHIVDDLRPGKVVMGKTRTGFGEALAEIAEKNESIVAACADLTESTQMNFFADKFPDRFIEVGVAEQNLVTVGAGLAASGKIPFVSSYAAFSPGRNWEQIRTTICLNDRPVKIIGSHAGLYTGADGATHQMLEDFALMRSLPNMVVLAPCDYIEAQKATRAMAEDTRPNYMRLTREETPTITTPDTPFKIGKAQIFAIGQDVTIISTGVMTYQAVLAAETLYKQGIDAEVLHMATIKPFDAVAVLKSVKKTKKVIVVEEHQVNGGLAGAVAEFLGEHLPTPIKRIGVRDAFGESGTPHELLKYHGLTAKDIVLAAHDITENGGKDE